LKTLDQCALVEGWGEKGGGERKCVRAGDLNNLVKSRPLTAPKLTAAFLPQKRDVFIQQRMLWEIEAEKVWNGVSEGAFVGLCLMSEPLHEANSTCKAKILQKCAIRSIRKNIHHFTVFGVASTRISRRLIEGFSGLGYYFGIES